MFRLLIKKIILQCIINGWNCGFSENYRPAFKPYKIFDAVLHFFDFYGSFDSAKWVISPLLGRLITKRDIKSKDIRKLPNMEDYCEVDGEIQLDKPFCVQDPFDLIHNVTRGLTQDYLDRFQSLCRLSASLFRQILQGEIPLAKLFEPIELNDEDMPNSAGADQASKAQPEVITLDEDTSDSPKETDIIEDINLMYQRAEAIAIDDNDLRHGMKRTLGDNPKITPEVESCSSNDSIQILSTGELTSDEKLFVTQLEQDSPNVYVMRMPTNPSFTLDSVSGNVISNPGLPTDETQKTLGLDILEYIFQHIFKASMIRNDIDDSPSKRRKMSTEATPPSCYATLEVKLQYDLEEGRKRLLAENKSLQNYQGTPFSQEKRTTQLQLSGKNFVKHSMPRTLKFFVCHARWENGDSHDIVLIGNTMALPEKDTEFLNSFMSYFLRLTNSLLERTRKYLIGMKRTKSPHL